jgi:hypothetical protein
MEKKRHHYVPKAYLKFFCDGDGKIRVYRKCGPDKVLHQSPDNIAFHKYYYSQPLPKGGRENSALEDAFSELEGRWPPIVERLLRRENVNDSLEDIFAFMALQRVRVPASRDATEQMRAELVKSTARRLDAAGKLPPKPKGFEDILGRVEVTIDPHQSLLAMTNMLDAVGSFFKKIGIGALHNTTETPFLTSDNPVIWLDPSLLDEEVQPYRLRPDGPIVLLFPVTPNLMIYGHSLMRPLFDSEGLRHSDLSEHQRVDAMNLEICRFAYNAVFAQHPGHEPLIRRYAGISPVLQTDVIPTKDGEFLLHRQVFGKRKRKPKWKGEPRPS